MHVRGGVTSGKVKMESKLTDEVDNANASYDKRDDEITRKTRDEHRDETNHRLHGRQEHVVLVIEL